MSGSASFLAGFALLQALGGLQQGTRFAAEPLPRLWVSGWVFRQELETDQARCPQLCKRHLYVRSPLLGPR
jgi:hypothetical protein